MGERLSLFERRRRRVRTALRAKSAGRPRLSVHRSGRHIYAQVIDDAAGRTLAAASTVEKGFSGPRRSPMLACRSVVSGAAVVATAVVAVAVTVASGAAASRRWLTTGRS